MRTPSRRRAHWEAGDPIWAHASSPVGTRGLKCWHFNPGMHCRITCDWLMMGDRTRYAGHTLRSVDASHRTATIAWMIPINIHPKPTVSVDAYSRTQGRTGNQSPSEPLGAASALIARYGGGGRRPEGTPVALVIGNFYARTLHRTSRLG